MRSLIISICFTFLFLLPSYGLDFYFDHLSAPIGPSIKGLSLGMPIDDVLKIVKEKFPEGKWVLIESKRNEILSQYMAVAPENKDDPDGVRTLDSLVSGWPCKPIAVLANKTNKLVCYIAFENVFGNVENITDDQFAQELLQAYGIKEATKEFVGAAYIYKHVNDAGWELKIVRKLVLLRAVPPKAPRKFD